jgi:hypothetical protein
MMFVVSISGSSRSSQVPKSESSPLNGWAVWDAAGKAKPARAALAKSVAMVFLITRSPDMGRKGYPRA